MNPTLLAFIKKEFIQALRDKRMRMIIFVIPVVQMTLFGLALSNEIKNIRLAVYAAPGDHLAQKLGERAAGSGWFRLVPSDDPDPFHLVRAGRADAVLVAPPGGLTWALARDKGQAQLLVDASNAIKGRVIESYMNVLLRRTIADENQNPEVSLASPPGTLTFDVRVLYNPTLETSAYLVPGVMGLILCLVTILLASMSMAREREMGTFETLLAAPVERWEIFVGKTLPFMILGMADVPLMVGLGVWGFQVPLRGPLWALFLAAAVFVATTVCVGTLISTFAKNQQQAMMGGFLFLFPAIQLSGVMAPIDNIPGVFAPLSWVNPLRFFVSLTRQVMLKGTIGSFYWTNLAALAFLGILAASASVRRFRRSLG
jgi:ABC-2 type transport system permease protein